MRRALLLLLLLPALASCQGAAPGSLEVRDAWASPPAPGMSMTAGYLHIANGTGAADRLLSVESPEVGSIEIHETVRDGDTLRMVAHEDGLEVPRDGLTLEPGGAHLMLMGLAGEKTAGDAIPVRLRFERAGTVEAALAVRER